MGNRKFHIWSEGYSITGNNSGAIYLGEFEADTFEHACDECLKTQYRRLRNRAARTRTGLKAPAHGKKAGENLPKV